jgi:hypothetical protein
VTFRLRASDGSALTIDGARIAPPARRPQLVVSVGDGTWLAGLINAHDHLQLNHYPRLGRPPYRNAYEWGCDIHARFKPQIRRAGTLPPRYAYLFGALKNLLGAVTTVVQHDPWHPCLARGFPVRVARLRVAHSLGFERDWGRALAGNATIRDRPLSMHVAEGTDGRARSEVLECARRGLLRRDLLAVHLVAADGRDARRLRRAGAAVVWCPTSNLFLFGRTAKRALFERGPNVLIGTDSLLTAQGTMLDELRAARRLRRLSPRRLRAAVGRTAARRLGLPPPSLKAGAPADVVFLRRPLFRARPRDVALVIVDGRPRLGDARLRPLFAHCGVRVERLSVGGVEKLVMAPLATAARRAMALTAEAGRILE